MGAPDLSKNQTWEELAVDLKSKGAIIESHDSMKAAN